MEPKPSRRRVLVPALIAVLTGALLLVVPRLGPAPIIPLPSIEPGAITLLAVGDIGSCDGNADEAVASLASALPGTIAILGDIAYPGGSTGDFASCFAPAWGPLLPRMRPAPGNHEYQTTDASGYFSYFGDLAGTPGEGWYSYELGAWHVIALNSNCAFVGCDLGSAQHDWLVADLLASPATCTLAYWHHPRYSSGRHGDDPQTDALWRVLSSAGADLVLTAHDHSYERIGPIDSMRSFVVGTGGRSLFEFARPPGLRTELRVNDSYGLLMLTLRDADFSWRFVPAAGSTLRDAGTAPCH
ncbi:MAG: metallophosphoesterase [Chloroflexota bacterium]